jgi:3alpha(or 20beta)-hydroxysteroid dehydrogenase
VARFDGRVVLVTGAARGMGASQVAAFVAEGARVMATDVTETPGHTEAARHGEAVRYMRLDVTSADDWAQAVTATEAVFGPVDVLVNNAGVGCTGGILEQTTDDFQRVMAVNVLGTFLGMRAVVPGMCARHRGAVVNISSISGLTGRPDGVAYCTSKWASRGMTKTAALDVAGTGVRINSVHPGIIATPMTEGMSDADCASQAIPRLGLPDEVSRVVLFAASDEASYCTGAEFVVDGGYTSGVIGHASLLRSATLEAK